MSASGIALVAVVVLLLIGVVSDLRRPGPGCGMTDE